MKLDVVVNSVVGGAGALTSGLVHPFQKEKCVSSGTPSSMEVRRGGF